MSLNAGEQLGRYTVVGPLGAGGMGEVYRATDTNLNREVALKVLPETMSNDPERVARFEREARLLASLNHPFVAAIYGFEEADGKRFLVLELVEGQTLEERLVDGRLTLPETLNIARQIAEAFEAAHDKSIIHRDLKPANVKITPDGQVKVLDFGLAKASAEEEPETRDPGTSPTVTAHFTQPGVILGTAAFMSPEQARGQAVDKRTDIWSFGCLLFQCLTGDTVFGGETITDSVAAILHKDPNWDRLPTETPPTIKRLLKRCLTKDRKNRLHDIADARIELESAIDDPTESSLEIATTPASPQEAGMRRIPTALLLVIGMAVGAIVTGAFFWRPTTVPGLTELPLRKLKPTLEGLTELTSSSPAILSPDGRQILYVRDEQIWIKDLQKLNPRSVPGTEGARFPFWSPDSRSIAYFNDTHLWRVDTAGGTPTAVTKRPDDFRLNPTNAGGTWLTDSRIVFCGANTSSAASGGLWEVSSRGGTPRVLLKPEGKQRVVLAPSSLPDGRGLLFVVQGPGQSQEETIMVFDGRNQKIVLQEDGESFATPVYSATGHILYLRRTTTPGLWAVPFSLDRLDTTGEPFFVAEGSLPSVGRDGSLVYRPGASFNTNPVCRLVWIHESGQIELIATRDQPMDGRVSLVPGDDQSRALVTVWNAQDGSESIWLHDLERGTADRVTFPAPGVIDSRSAWHPDGKHFLFQRTGAGQMAQIMMGLVEGTSQPEEVVTGNNFSLSPDGKYLAYEYFPNPDNLQNRDIAYLTLDSDAEPVVLLDSPSFERGPQLSPDGRLLAYSSNRSGRSELYLTRFPSGEGRKLVSVSGGTVKFWGPDREHQSLYYLDFPGTSLYRVTIKLDAEDENPEIGVPELLFDLPEVGLRRMSIVAPSADEKRFLAVQRVDFDPNNLEDRNQEVVLVQNWFSEFDSEN